MLNIKYYYETNFNLFDEQNYIFIINLDYHILYANRLFYIDFNLENINVLNKSLFEFININVDENLDFYTTDTTIFDQPIKFYMNKKNNIYMVTCIKSNLKDIEIKTGLVIQKPNKLEYNNLDTKKIINEIGSEEIMSFLKSDLHYLQKMKTTSSSHTFMNFDKISKNDDIFMYVTYQNIEILIEQFFSLAIMKPFFDKFKMIAENVQCGIYELSQDLICIYVNPYLKNFLNLNTPNEILNMMFIKNNDTIIDIINKGEYEKKTEYITSYIEYVGYVKIKQEEKWLSHKLLKVDDKYIGIIQDLNDMQLVHNQLEKALNLKTLFLANMSHEIRTPLNGIIGMLTLLEDTEITKEQLNYIDMIKECSYSLIAIVNDILDYSKLEAGKISLEMTDFNLQELVESVNDIIISKVLDKKLSYNYKIDSTIPDKLEGDPHRIKQILLNLLGNSIKFTDSGEIILIINLIKNEDYMLKFTIRDTGCGINIKDQDKLFKLFSQIETSIVTKIHQGTGLGLIISKGLVELMNGTIWLNHSSELGSEFCFTIPFKMTEQLITEKRGVPEILKDKHVLIIDNNYINRISISGMIHKWGAIGYPCASSEEALLYINYRRYDLILLDICLPKISGNELANIFKKEYPDIPMIAISSLGYKLDSTNVFDGYIYKPIKEHKLEEICINLLSPDTITKEIEEINNNDLDIRILIVEDNHINVQVMSGFLKKLGYGNIKIVNNGKLVFDILKDFEFDIILLDIKMPLMDGSQVLKQLRDIFIYKTLPNIYKNKKIPYTIAITAYSLLTDKSKYLTQGFNDYISKPVEIKELKRCIDNFYLDTK